MVCQACSEWSVLGTEKGCADRKRSGPCKNGSQFVVSAVDESEDYNISIEGSANFIGAGNNGRVSVDQTTATEYKIEAVTGGVVISSEGKYLTLEKHDDGYMYLALKAEAIKYADVFELTTENNTTYNDIRIIDDFASYSEKQVYTIATPLGNFVYTPNGIGSTTKDSIEINENDPNQQFVFLKNPDNGKRYLYSVGGKVFLKQTGDYSPVIPTLWDASQEVEILLSRNYAAKQNYPAVLRIGSKNDKFMIGVSPHHNPGVIGLNNQAEEGNALAIRPVEDVLFDKTFSETFTDPLYILRGKYETAKTYSVGEGSNQYSVIINTDGKDVSYNNSWDAAIAESAGIFNGTQEASEERIQYLIETFEKYIPQLRHNTVHENAFVRIQSIGEPGVYVQNVNTDDNSRLAVSTTKDKNSIFLIKDGALVSYSKGVFVKHDRSILALATTPGEKTAIEIVSTTSETDGNKYALKFKLGYNLYYQFLFATSTKTGSEEFSGKYPLDPKFHFALEPVTELPITMNNVDGGYYGTINFPVAVELPEGLSAYSATEKGERLILTKVAEGGQVLAANTPVIIYSNNNVDYVTISSENGVGATDNCLSGTVEAKTVVSGANYVLGNKEGLAFYKYTNTKMPAFKAYLAPSAALSQKFGFIFADDDLTGVANAIKEAAKTNTSVFDINGRMVNELVKGQLYIQGGKKFRY